MTVRRRIVAGNWKMHTTPEDGVALAGALAAGWSGTDSKLMIVAPPFTHLGAVHTAIAGSGVGLAAQNCHWEAQGAFTGEISTEMLKGSYVGYVIVGHSERRELFNESNEVVRRKLDAVLAAGMQVILCCGESLSTREAGKARDFVGAQIQENLLHRDASDLASVIIAYEPIWAIGTGVTATAAQAQEMHAFIRGLIREAYGADTAEGLSILYGGSVKASNASELFGQADVDGGLVGGASLDAPSFLQIGAAL